MLSNLRFSVRTSSIVLVMCIAGSVAVASAQTINGGFFSDTLSGTAGDDVIDGGWGDDTLAGLGGNDQMLGNLGSDHVDGGAGNDVLKGGSGFDSLLGGAGHDVIDTDSGPATADGGSGLDEIMSDIGAQTSVGGADNDVLISLTGTSLHNQDGGDGNDVVDGWGVVRGGAGDDILTNNGGTLIDGGPGNDVCRRAALTPTTNCETVVTIGFNLFAPSLSVTNVPAENATLTTNSVSASFTSSNAAGAYCLVDTGAVVACSGTYTATGLANGDHALAIVVVSGGAQPAKVFVRHFKIVWVPAIWSISNVVLAKSVSRMGQLSGGD
jgi:Ca2+-binding RTX toxin-like protein